MKKIVRFNFVSRCYYTIHSCPYIVTVSDMGAKIPWCPMVKDFPEYGDVSHCFNCSFWRSPFDNEFD